MTSALRSSLDNAPMNTYRWLAVALCMLLNMIDGFDVLVMAFTAASVSAEWKLNGAQLGTLLSAGLFGMAAGSLLLAPLADRFGRRHIIIGSLLICAVAMTISARAQTSTELGILRVITGVGIGGILACSNVIASEYASLRWRGLAVSLQSTGYALGATIGGSIAVWLLGQYGWRSVFLFGGVVAFAALPLVVWRLPESIDFLSARQPKDALKKINELAKRGNIPEIAALPAKPTSGRARGGAVRSLLSPEKIRATILVWSSFFLVMFGFYFVMSWTPRLLVASGMTAKQGVTAGVLLSVGGIVGTALLGVLAARFAVHRLLSIFMVFAAVLSSVFIMNLGDQQNAFVMAFILGAFVNACVAGLYAIAPLVYDTSVRAAGVGWGIGMGRIGGIASPIVAGSLIDLSFKPAELYVAFSAAFAIAAAIVLMHRIVRPGAEPAQQAAAASA